jgi:signal transduction histidine kinase
VVLTLAQGMGILIYAALWVLLPADRRFEEDTPGLESATRGQRRPAGRSAVADAGPALALGVLGFGVVLGLDALLGSSVVLWPLVIALAGLALLWRQADEAQRERWLDSTGRIDPFRAVVGDGGWAAWLRIVAGLALILLALGVFAIRAGELRIAGDVVAAGAVGFLGLGLVVVPWAVRLVSDLAAERAERVRTQERADLASHLHDSVLQTLALIQRNAGDPATVTRLARSQERDLRGWLFETAPAGETTLRGALAAAAARVEDDHGVSVDVVTVGDAAMTERLQPLVAAAREAVVNAARHAGTGRVDVYAEVAEDGVDVFVRDRGAGFDPAAVATDRHGLRESIVGRMQRHGGEATVRSAPGEGTEVRLHLPRQEDQ